MLIKQDLIKDFSKDFVALEKSIEGCNYNVGFSARLFFFQPCATFTITMLRQVFSDKVNTTCLQDDCNIYTPEHQTLPCISGSIGECQHSFAKKEIEDALSFDHNLTGSVLFNKPTGYIEKSLTDRKQKFWAIIHHYYAAQAATQVLVHEASPDSFFGCGIMWQFCFIFINNKTNQGLVLDGFAHD